eukprot:IDg19661t1
MTPKQSQLHRESQVGNRADGYERNTEFPACAAKSVVAELRGGLDFAIGPSRVTGTTEHVRALQFLRSLPSVALPTHRIPRVRGCPITSTLSAVRAARVQL